LEQLTAFRLYKINITLITRKYHEISMQTGKSLQKLEYLAVYGRATMVNYYGCAFGVLAVFHQLSTHGQKFDPESLYEPI